MSQYQNSTTPALSKNISSLLPPGISNPPSLTQYLGVKDWYSMHYLRTCSGFFAVSSTSSPLTPKKINITCMNQPAGYTFILNDLLRKGLHPGVQALADEIPESRIVTEPFYAMWQVGQVTGILALVSIPSTWAGTRRANGYCAVWSFVCASFLFQPPTFPRASIQS